MSTSRMSSHQVALQGLRHGFVVPFGHSYHHLVVHLIGDTFDTVDGRYDLILFLLGNV